MRHLTTFAALSALISMAAPSYVAAQSSPSDYTSGTRYDAVGRVTGTIAPDPDGAGSLKYLATRTTYDARGNVTMVETGELTSWQDQDQDPHSDWGTAFTIHTITEMTYDSMSRKLTVKVSGKEGATVTPVSMTQFSYDSLGRLECTAVRMNPATWGSLPSSACTLGTQGSYGPDRIAKLEYAPNRGTLVGQVRKAVGTSLEQADVTRSYTANGLVEQTIDANGNRAKFTYDGFDRLQRWTFPSPAQPLAFNDSNYANALATAGMLNDADYEEYGYDSRNNRTSLRKRDGYTINYSYDNLGRMTLKDLPYRADLDVSHRRDVHYRYDLRGLQTLARFDSTTGPGIGYGYDGFGRLTSEAQNSDGTSRTVSSLYDANGNRTRVTHPDAQYFELAFDGLNRATGIKQATITLGTASYNSRGLPTQLAWTYAASSTNARNFGYDSAGRLSSLGFDLNSTSADVTWSYTRNPTAQILTETQSNDSYSWNGHATINRSYAVNGLNQYAGAGSAAFCYDANGNLTADGASVYKYDLENRLVERRDQGAGNTNCAALIYTGTLRATLKYDPTGRLYEVSGGTLGIQRFAYDGNALIAEYNSSGTMLRRYVHGSNVEADDALIWYEGSSAADATRRYLHADPRGSIVAVTNYQGTSTATNTYDEYGIPDSASGADIATKGRFRYTGQAWIPELGMYYYKARIYSPTLGRFLQTDPIGYEDQFNLYAYVGNDPINGVDPSGRIRYKLSFDVSGAILIGGDTAVSLELDTETLEIGGSVEVGANVGIGGTAGGSFEKEASSEKGNEISITGEVKAEAEAGVRLGRDRSIAAEVEASAGYEGRYNESNGGSRGETEPVLRAAATAGDRHRSTDGRGPSDRYGAGAEAKAGASVRIEGNVSFSSAWDRAKAAWKKIWD